MKKDIRTSTGADTFPSLYAALTPESTPQGDRGFRVTCTVTRKPLGFVWWTCSGKTVTWHYCAPDGQVGERTTKRNAVQALRDVKQGQLRANFDAACAALPPVRSMGDTPTTTPRPTTTTTTTTTTKPALPTTRIQWTTANTGGDLRDSIARGLNAATKKETK